MIVGLVSLLIAVRAVSAPMAADPAALDKPCPVEWRNTPFKHALEELTGSLGLPVLLDESVTPDALQTPVRIFAQHLTCRQALTWLARWTGFEAAFIEGSVLIADPDRLPRVWRKELQLGSASQPAPSETWSALRSRSADVDWVDAPLSLIARDVSARFGVDVLVHPEVLRAEGLVNLRQPGATLGQVCDAVADQLNAAIDWVDGALWVHPRVSSPATHPATPTAPTPPPTTPAALLDALLTRPIVVGDPPADWDEFARELISGVPVEYHVQADPGAARPDFVAQGTAREILEAAKLMRRLEYRLEPAGKGNTPLLVIKAR